MKSICWVTFMQVKKIIVYESTLENIFTNSETVYASTWIHLKTVLLIRKLLMQVYAGKHLCKLRNVLFEKVCLKTFIQTQKLFMRVRLKIVWPPCKFRHCSRKYTREPWCKFRNNNYVIKTENRKLWNCLCQYDREPLWKYIVLHLFYSRFV